MVKPKGNARGKFKPERVLVSWRRVIRRLPKMTEDELEAALEAEKEGAKREDVIFRIARRLNTVRRKKALEELLT